MLLMNDIRSFGPAIILNITLSGEQNIWLGQSWEEQQQDVNHKKVTSIASDNQNNWCSSDISCRNFNQKSIYGEASQKI